MLIEWMVGSWNAYLASLQIVQARADDTITNLAKEREPGDIEHIHSLIFDY